MVVIKVHLIFFRHHDNNIVIMTIVTKYSVNKEPVNQNRREKNGNRIQGRRIKCLDLTWYMYDMKVFAMLYCHVCNAYLKPLLRYLPHAVPHPTSPSSNSSSRM